MRVLAIGATGFIGLHVVRLLVQQGHEVAILHRGETHPAFRDVRHILGDRNALAEMMPELRSFAPEVVLDMIAYTERQAQRLIDAFRGLTGRVVVVSSSDVYRNYDGLRRNSVAPPDPVPLSEEAPLRETLYPYRSQNSTVDPADEYEKILVERVVMETPDLPGTALRLPAVYGPGDRQHRLQPYLQWMQEGRAEILLSEVQAGWRWTRGYVENVAAAIALAVTDDRAVGRVYNVGEEETSTERQWVEAIGAVAGWPGQVVSLPAERLSEDKRLRFDFRYELATDTNRIRTELGFRKPVGHHEALRRTIAWERSETDPDGRTI